jgi:DNA primase small subunit
MCSHCLEKAKEEILKLIDLIHLDFGINLENIRVNFSGHRGYHLHIDSQQVRNLDTEDRKEIVDYIVGTGLDTNLLDIWEASGKIKSIGGLSPNDPGWRGRLAKRIIRIFSDADKETLKSIGLKPQAIDSILSLQTYNSNTNQDTSWRMIKGTGKHTWNILIQRAIALESVGIDTVVTTDIHRLIRVAGTLNGKTGLKAMKIEIEDLPEFNPFKQAVAFDGYETIHIEEAPRFMLGDQEYGPYNNVNEKLPRSAALLLLCKRRAHPVMN